MRNPSIPEREDKLCWTTAYTPLSIFLYSAQLLLVVVDSKVTWVNTVKSSSPPDYKKWSKMLPINLCNMPGFLNRQADTKSPPIIENLKNKCCSHMCLTEKGFAGTPAPLRSWSSSPLKCFLFFDQIPYWVKLSPKVLKRMCHWNHPSSLQMLCVL